MENLDYDRIPEHMRDSMRGYIEHGKDIGDFLYALLCDDIPGAFSKADDTNRDAMYEYVCFLHDEAPSTAWGSPEAVSDWIKRGGMQGIAE